LLFLGGSAALASLAVLVACVGDDPVSVTSTTDASTSDTATVDSPTSPADASVDAADERTFCEKLAPGTPCEDFERGAPETHGWLRDQRFDGGIEIVLAPDGPSGSSTIAKTNLPAHDTSAGTASARFFQTLTTSGTTNVWKLEADVRVQPGAFGNLSVFTFAYDGLNLPATLNLTDSDQAVLYADLPDGGLVTGTKFTMPRGTWVHLVMRIERVGGNTKLVAELDGVELSTVQGLGLPTAQHRISFGLLSTATTGATTLDIDNFAFHAD
jgi:hypothetical protein